MNILLLAQGDHGTTVYNSLFEALKSNVDNFDLRWLTSNEQANLRSYFRNIDTDRYDRIIMFLRFKKEIKQVRFIRTIPNLVILEYDACQNYIEGKYKGKFSKHYSRLPWSRIILSGKNLTSRIKSEGYDATFVPKGYDSFSLKNIHINRDIEMGFIGSTGHRVYKERKYFLEDLQQSHNILISKTKTIEEYNTLLNRIKYFISADIGFGEYMQKNFEAMACGCILCAWDQGDVENKAIGFEDMKNVVLYKSKNELLEKIKFLSENIDISKSIARSGQTLAEQNFSFNIIARRIVEALAPPLREKKSSSLLGFKRYHL